MFQRLKTTALEIAARLRARSFAELLPLAVFAAAAAALAAFVELAEDVMEGDTRGFDEAILRALRTASDPAEPVGPYWLDAAMRDITALGSYTVLAIVTFGAVGYLLIDRKRAAALFVLVSVCGGALLSTALKLGFARPRPELVAHLVDVRTLSFPSGHAMLSAVTFLTIGALLARQAPRARHRGYLLALAIALALLVGVSRVYLGVHWPTDVLAGWCLGSAWAMVCWVAAWWLQQRGGLERSGERDAD